MKSTVSFDAPKSKVLIGSTAGALIGLFACAPALVGSAFAAPMIAMSVGVIGCLALAGTWFWLVFNLSETTLTSSAMQLHEGGRQPVEQVQHSTIAA